MIGAGLPCQCSLVILCHICTTRFLCVDDTIASAQVKGTAWFQDHDVPVGVCPPISFLWYVHCREIRFSHLHGTLAYPYT